MCFVLGRTLCTVAISKAPLLSSNTLQCTVGLVVPIRKPYCCISFANSMIGIASTDFNLNGPGDYKANEDEYEEDQATPNASAEFLQWHHRLGHLSPNKIRIMAKNGVLPKRLSKCAVPMCTSCLYGKATKRAWRGKTRKSQAFKKETLTEPGQDR